jgi:hypothetical protein
MMPVLDTCVVCEFAKPAVDVSDAAAASVVIELMV